MLQDNLFFDRHKSHGFTPLVSAAVRGDKAVVKGVGIEKICFSKGLNRTAVEFSVQFDHEPVLKLLLDMGANVCLYNDYRTCFEVGIRKGH